MDNNKYKTLFIEESREHLGELSRLLVDIESNSNFIALIDEIFRHAHSIKGMAGAMDYGEVALLSHRIEDVVDTCRSNKRPIAKNTIDLLLGSIDALSSQIDNIVEDQKVDAYSSLVAALVAENEALSKVAATEKNPDLPPKSNESASLASTTAILANSNEVDISTLSIRLGANVPAANVRALLIYRQLGKFSTIIATKPTTAELKNTEYIVSELQIIIRNADEDAIRKALAYNSEIESLSFTAADLPENFKPIRSIAAVNENPKSSSTVRVRTEILDNFINSVGELFIARERIVSLLDDIERPELRAALDVLTARIREIHDQVMAVRMMPLRTLTERLPRIVRDLCRSLSKEVELEIIGSEIELDRAILDQLDSAFIHTLRNAIDHGIELPNERQASGKTLAGKITITAARDRDAVLVTISDDGRGLDPLMLRQVALSRGLISHQESEHLSLRDSYFLICLPGFSSKTEVSDISGRGVGMDAVRARIESLGGSLDIESEIGCYTKFILRLPLTLAIVPVLLVESASIVFAIPLAKVLTIREKGTKVAYESDGTSYLSFQNTKVPIIELAELLHLKNPSRLAEYVVIIEDGRELIGLAVQKLVGHHDAVVKPLGDPLDRLDAYSGAAILGDGNPILILDVPRAVRGLG
ncbi:MAG: chemotaxis protein CheA [Deltaproteobacteria bacterium]|nr:chemotaxis protein CheA [Deltaproteobacteria bacterium]